MKLAYILLQLSTLPAGRVVQVVATLEEAVLASYRQTYTVACRVRRRCGSRAVEAVVLLAHLVLVDVVAMVTTAQVEGAVEAASLVVPVATVVLA